MSIAHTALRYNQGQECQSLGQHEEALEHFLAVVEADPHDWKSRAKVIQEYQALDRLEERDVHRAKLLELRRTGEVEALNQRDLYCRDQFTAAGRRVMVLEYFDLQGVQPARYTFMVMTDSGRETTLRISLGSYANTTRWAQEKGTQSGDERVFHLDAHPLDGGIQTYAFFRSEPAYDEVRQMVVDILEGRREPLPTEPEEDSSDA